MNPRNPAIHAALEAIAHGAQEVQIPHNENVKSFTSQLRAWLLKTTGKHYRLVNAQTDTPAILVREGVK
jgi:hypothetical protein